MDLSSPVFGAVAVVVFFVSPDGLLSGVAASPGFSVSPEEIFTVMVAVSPPPTVVTVIVAVPFPTAVTSPFASTVATIISLDFHVPFLFVASLGSTVAVSCVLFPFAVSVLQ